MNEELQASAQETSGAKKIKAKKTMRGSATVTRSRRAKPPDGNTAVTTVATPLKNTRPMRRAKKTATAVHVSTNKQGMKSDDRGGIQTNEIGAVAGDK